MSILDGRPRLVIKSIAVRGRITVNGAGAIAIKDINRINEMSEVGAKIIVAKCSGILCSDCPARETIGECPVCGCTISDHNARQHMLNPGRPVRCVCGAVILMCADMSVCGVSVPVNPLIDRTEDDVI